MTIKETYNVLIMGGGIAALAAAIDLSGKGLRVLVVRPRGPASTYGESLDWEAPALLSALGIDLATLVAQDKATVKRGAVASYAPVEGRFEIGFHPAYRALMWLVGRSAPTYHVDKASLIAMMEQRAAESGATIVEDTITQLTVDGERVMGVSLKQGQPISADHYIDATGRVAKLAHELALEARTFGERKVSFSARQAASYDHRGTRIRLDDHGDCARWCWDIHVGEALTDVGVVFLAREVKQAKQQGATLERWLDAQARRHPDLVDRLGEGWAAEAARYTCSFQDRVYSRLQGPNWWLIGESAAVIDPLLSSGVTFALRSAKLASASIAARQRQAPKAEALAARYERKLISHATTVNTLLEHAWYKHQLRRGLGLRLNVLLVLVVNFNLNHLHARAWTRSAIGVAVLAAAHRALDTLIIWLMRQLSYLSDHRQRRCSAKALPLNPSGAAHEP